MKIYDESGKVVDIRMFVFPASPYSERVWEFTNDFFEDVHDSRHYDADKDAYLVENVDYCISDAQDWADDQGEFGPDSNYYWYSSAEDAVENPVDKWIEVTEITG